MQRIVGGKKEWIFIFLFISKKTKKVKITTDKI